MHLTAAVEHGVLTVKLTVRNDFDETIYLMNWLFDWYGLLGIPELDAAKNRKHARPTRELAHVRLGSHGQLVLFQGFSPEPYGDVSATQPRHPYGTRLGKGQVFRGELTQPLPPQEWHAYEPPSAKPTQSVRTRTIDYRLDVLRESVCFAPAREHPSFPGAFVVNGHPADTLRATTQLDEPITVLQRTDKIERFPE